MRETQTLYLLKQLLDIARTYAATKQAYEPVIRQRKCVNGVVNNVHYVQQM